MTIEPDILGYVTAKATEASKMLDTRKLIIIHVHVFAAKNTKLIKVHCKTATLRFPFCKKQIFS